MRGGGWGRGGEGGQGKRRKERKKEGALQGEVERGGPAGAPLWARQTRHYGLVGPSTLGPPGSPLWARPARHPWARPASHLGALGPSSIKLVGWPRALKKLNSCPSRPVDWSTGL